MYISIDIGGTNTRVASSHNLRDIENVVNFESPASLAELRVKIADAIKKISGTQQVKAISIGVAGILNHKTGTIEKSPNYSALNGIKYTDLISDISHVEKVFAHNDAHIAGLGEAVLGAGRKYARVAYISIGTGVGGVFVSNKKLQMDLCAIEPGHQIINFSDTVAGSFGLAGTYESYVSGPAFKNLYGQSAHLCTDENIWYKYGKNVGIGLVNITLLWAPDCIVIGGGISEKFDSFITGVEETLHKLQYVPLPKVVKSAFGQGSGVVGGFVFMSQIKG